MLNYFRNKYRTFQLKAENERVIQEKLLSLVEQNGPNPVSEDPGDWKLLGQNSRNMDSVDQANLREKARELVQENPHAKNMLRLLEIYVVGPGLKLHHQLITTPLDKTGQNTNQNEQFSLAQQADQIWKEFLFKNHQHFSYREFARRVWRDGECFLRLFPQLNDVPTVRFIDPEWINSSTEYPESNGILTDMNDVETVIAYLKVNPISGDLEEEIPESEILHSRWGVDSNQKRGSSLFEPVLSSLSNFSKWMETELTARRLQASIVLWRKVQGSPSQASSIADSSSYQNSNDPGWPTRREKYRPGTIITTSQGTELEFLQPNTNFRDAVTLGRTLLLCTAAGAGLPEFMLTSDASNSNFASTMVAEGPAVKMFQSEQEYFVSEFRRLWKWVMQLAVDQKKLPADFFDQVEVEWSVPELVNRDRPQERLADARLVETGVLSRAEIARRDGADPQLMRSEIHDEIQIEEENNKQS
jgi:capsid protein